MSFKLVNAQEMAKRYPETFEAPLKHELDKLNIGDVVKLCFEREDTQSERMWVIVTYRNGNELKGKLDNDPFVIDDIKCGDMISFNLDHVFRLGSIHSLFLYIPIWKCKSCGKLVRSSRKGTHWYAAHLKPFLDGKKATINEVIEHEVWPASKGPKCNECLHLDIRANCAPCSSCLRRTIIRDNFSTREN